MSFEMSYCEEKKFRFMCLSIKVIFAWFHFLLNLWEAGKMGNGKEMQEYFSFPATG